MKLEQRKKRSDFSFEEYLKPFMFQFSFFSEKRKKYYCTPCFNKKRYFFLENRFLNAKCYSTSIFSLKSSKIDILQYVSDTKNSKKKTISLLKKNSEISSVLKRVKSGFLLNLLGAVAFIPFSFYEEKFSFVGKNLYLKLIKLKIVHFGDKILINSFVTRKLVIFKLKTLFKDLFEKSLAYSFFSDYKRLKSSQIFCRYQKKLCVKLIKETVFSL